MPKAVNTSGAARAIRQAIRQRLGKGGSVRSSEIAEFADVSRVYAHRVLQELVREGTLVLVGKANRARYVRADKRIIQRELAKELQFRASLKNEDLAEDVVLTRIRRETGIFRQLPSRARNIVAYAFTEMLNNAIEHSRSASIDVVMTRSQKTVSFIVRDQGVGVFTSIMNSRHLASEREAIQDLLKGKTTTSPERHSGEGIFFTSKAGDRLELSSAGTKIVFDNTVGDVFIRSLKARIGTLVEFTITVDTSRELARVFNAYTGDTLAFDKTSVTVQLYKAGKELLSRSQARRLLVGLEKFREIVLDFAGVDTIGQGFADEVFRVWRSVHPGTAVHSKNAGRDVQFMIAHAEQTGATPR